MQMANQELNKSPAIPDYIFEYIDFQEQKYFFLKLHLYDKYSELFA